MSDTQKDEAKELARKFSNYVNCYNSSAKDVVAELSNEHRTLQQGITKFCVAWLEEMAKKEASKMYDLRNEASVKLGAKFMAVTDSRDRAMPFI